MITWKRQSTVPFDAILAAAIAISSKLIFSTQLPVLVPPITTDPSSIIMAEVTCASLEAFSWRVGVRSEQRRSPRQGVMAQNGGARDKNVSWRNGSLQRKSELDYRMPWYARKDVIMTGRTKKRIYPKASVLVLVRSP